MNKINSDIIAVIKRFPDRKDVLQKLYRKSEDFQTMCEDYHKCRQASDYWSQPDRNQPDKKTAVKHREEYAVLLVELESEIIQTLDEYI